MTGAGRADLHVHTRASDGASTSEEVVAMALRAGLDALGIADHDTVDGVRPALEAARDTALEIVPGVEINTDYRRAEVHVLGYLFRPDHPMLEERLTQLRVGRLARVQEMVAKLKSLRLHVELERVLELAGDGSVGRPHVAQAMVEKGYVVSMREAFDRYLGRGRPAYVERARFSPAEAVRLVIAAGGVPVLAHPGLGGDDLLVEELVAEGLAGLEVYHPDHTPEIVVHLLRLAVRHDLVVTGGSDYHAPGASCGAPVGQVTVPHDTVDALRRRLPSVRA